MRGPFDKFYRKNQEGCFDWDELRNRLADVAAEYWRLKGIDKGEIGNKLELLCSEMRKWSYNKRIVVGNSYSSLISKLEGRTDDGGSERKKRAK